MRHKQIDITFVMLSVEQIDSLYGFHSRANKLAYVSCCFGILRVCLFFFVFFFFFFVFFCVCFILNYFKSLP